MLFTLIYLLFYIYLFVLLLFYYFYFYFFPLIYFYFTLIYFLFVIYWFCHYYFLSCIVSFFKPSPDPTLVGSHWVLCCCCIFHPYNEKWGKIVSNFEERKSISYKTSSYTSLICSHLILTSQQYWTHGFN